VHVENFGIVGIYDAEDGLTGELKYLAGKLFSNKKCDLCDVTHGWNPFGKRKWKKALEKESLSISLIHRNQASDLHKKVAGSLPAIICNKSGKWECILNSSELKRLKNNPEEIIEILNNFRIK